MKTRPDYYRILHVQPDAPTAVIKASHRTLMQQLKMHPDLGGDHAHAVLINEAFATLCDPEARAAYDRTRARPDASSRPPEPRPAAPSAPGPSPHSHRTPPTPRQPLSCVFCEAPGAPANSDWPHSVCHACGSALFPAQKHQVTQSSRRTLERLPRSMPLTFRRAVSRQHSWDATTEDVSLNGARFATDVDIRVGECLSLDCQFCSAVAIVRSVAANAGHGGGRHHVGVEFVTLRIKQDRGGLVSTVA
jgi:hypothetical protein